MDEGRARDKITAREFWALAPKSLLRRVASRFFELLRPPQPRTCVKFGEGPALDLLLQTELGSDIPLLIQWSLELMELGIPTAYIFTKTKLMEHRPWPEGEGHQRWGQKRQLI
ncbi:hypothetical protein KEM48_010554 [Puccinia striiformis f. sp. tritici PST-130]|nr:hypothetical protein KEM48_010554 [Puccinia striiformis f. sp. tritici PST-130]